jgi:hypothetical protein
MHRPPSLGLYSEPPPPDGVAPHAGSKAPGPIATVTGSGAGPVAGASPLSTEFLDDDAVRIPFEVSGRLYRLRRTDTAWHRAPNERNVAPEEAIAILERAIGQHSTHVRHVRLLEAAVRKLAGLHDRGVYVLLWLQPGSQFEKVATPARAPAARPLARPAVLPEPPPIEEPVMPLMQAAALKNAALLGVPFCEECARAAAERAAHPA